MANRDLICGAVFVAVAGIYAITASSYPLGTALVMGPGYFPLLLSAVLAMLGVFIMAQAVRGGGRLEISRRVARPLVLVSAAPIAFAFLAPSFGLGPAVLATALLGSYSVREGSHVSALATAAGILAVSVAVFAYGLRIPVPLIGPALRQLFGAT